MKYAVAMYDPEGRGDERPLRVAVVEADDPVQACRLHPYYKGILNDENWNSSRDSPDGSYGPDRIRAAATMEQFHKAMGEACVVVDVEEVS